MAAITYTAHSRATLISGHTAGVQYSFDVKLRAFSSVLEQPKDQHVSLSGYAETILTRATKIHSTVFIFPDTLKAQMEEFLYSVAAGESFEFDPYGTVAIPDAVEEVISVSKNLSLVRMQHGPTPWLSVSMALRPLIP